MNSLVFLLQPGKSVKAVGIQGQGLAITSFSFEKKKTNKNEQLYVQQIVE